jgi:transcriptional pleiotropic repressor
MTMQTAAQGMSLAERARRINRLLQSTGGRPVDFEEMAHVLSDVIGCNVYLVGRGGKVLGYALQPTFACDVLNHEILRSRQMPEAYNRRILEVETPLANIAQDKNHCVFTPEMVCPFEGKLTTVVPVVGGGQRLGTLLLARFKVPFSEEDLVLADWGATLVGMEVLRQRTEEIETEARRKAAVQVAIGTLSYSELQAAHHIFQELGGREEGLLVASRIADRVGITRSVIVNALRKFESAGVIESRSLGMKGTHIRILNSYLLPELSRYEAS